MLHISTGNKLETLTHKEFSTVGSVVEGIRICEIHWMLPE